MRGWFGLVRKNALDSRWLLLTLTLALFWLSWLFVFFVRQIERRMQREAGFRPMREIRALAGEGASGAFEMNFWGFPFILIIVVVWGIARGSQAVAGELEKGTMDLVLSRPVSRWAFLSAQVVVALGGLLLMAGAMIAGNRASAQYNLVVVPPTTLDLIRPAANLVALGWAVFGYTLLASSVDLVRWRPILLASTLTLAMFIALIIAGIRELENWKWLENVSIFHAYQPVKAFLGPDPWAKHVAILGGIGLGGTSLALIAFGRRDLPAGS